MSCNNVHYFAFTVRRCSSDYISSVDRYDRNPDIVRSCDFHAIHECLRNFLLNWLKDRRFLN
nr:MAG TPA: hypothetical protein [Caudoviricetes sp.]